MALGVEYSTKESSIHLTNALQDKCEELDINWNDNKLCGISLNWDYDKRSCTISLPNYIKNRLKRFRHHVPTKLQHALADYKFPVSGQKQQHETSKPALKPLNPKEIKCLQETIGVCR